MICLCCNYVIYFHLVNRALQRSVWYCITSDLTAPSINVGLMWTILDSRLLRGQEFCGQLGDWHVDDDSRPYQ